MTGGGGEIGRATALRLAREGAIVVVTDIQPDQAEQVVREITDSGGAAWAMRVDVAERTEVEHLAQAVYERHGRIDVLCNIAGIALQSPLLEADEEN